MKKITLSIFAVFLIMMIQATTVTVNIKSNATLIVPNGAIPNYSSWQFNSSTIIEKTPISSGGTIFNSNFNSSNPCAELSGQCNIAGIQAKVAWATVGTIDIAKTSTASGAMRFIVETGSSNENWIAIFYSGLIAVINVDQVIIRGPHLRTLK